MTSIVRSMRLAERLGLEHPVVQAGMGGGIAGARLAGAVSAAGGLGTVGILPPAQFRTELERVRDLAPGKPFSANLLVPFMRRAHVEACVEARVAAVVFHAGLSRAAITQLRGAGVIVLQTVGTQQEALQALDAGVDGLIAQGVEAGGHLVGVEPALRTLSQVLAVAAYTPVLVAGGIADRDDTRRALDAGADGVVAGTRFLLTEECDAHPGYQQRVLAADRTLRTMLFGLGWPMPHRVVPNAATERWCRRDDRGPRAVIALERLSSPLARLPMSITGRTVKTQDPRVPLFGPATPLAGMPDRLVDSSALYAGETALRIDAIVPAARAVALLAG